MKGREARPTSGQRRSASGAKPAEFEYDKAIQPDRERPASQPGAILRVTIDINHWLNAGQDTETQVMFEGNRVFASLKLNSGDARSGLLITDGRRDHGNTEICFCGRTVRS